MRFGIALPITIQIAFPMIDSAALQVWPDGGGDIALSLRTRSTHRLPRAVAACPPVETYESPTDTARDPGRRRRWHRSWAARSPHPHRSRPSRSLSRPLIFSERCTCSSRGVTARHELRTQPTSVPPQHPDHRRTVVVLLSIMTAAAGRITGAANSAPTAAPVAITRLVVPGPSRRRRRGIRCEQILPPRSISSRRQPTAFCAPRCAASHASACVRTPTGRSRSA